MITRIIDPEKNEVFLIGWTNSEADTVEQMIFDERTVETSDNCKPFCVKVLWDGRTVDTGIFAVNDVQMKLKIRRRGQNLVMELDTTAKKSTRPYHRWYYPMEKPVVNERQIFARIDGSWEDVTKLPEMPVLWSKYHQNQINAKETWYNAYLGLQDLGISQKDARDMLKNGRWRDVDEFAKCLKLLREIKPARRKVKRALAIRTREHIKNVLNIDVKFVDGAHMALRWYAKEMGYELE